MSWFASSNAARWAAQTTSGRPRPVCSGAWRAEIDAAGAFEEEVVVALGSPKLAADGTLVGVHPHDVQRQPADDRQTGGGVALAVARLILVHRHVEHPVQAVLNAPVGTDDVPKRSADSLALSRK